MPRRQMQWIGRGRGKRGRLLLAKTFIPQKAYAETKQFSGLPGSMPPECSPLPVPVCPVPGQFACWRAAGMNTRVKHSRGTPRFDSAPAIALTHPEIYNGGSAAFLLIDFRSAPNRGHFLTFEKRTGTSRNLALSGARHLNRSGRRAPRCPSKARRNQV